MISTDWGSEVSPADSEICFSAGRLSSAERVSSLEEISVVLLSSCSFLFLLLSILFVLIVLVKAEREVLKP